jgi:hypothetical protein
MNDDFKTATKSSKATNNEIVKSLIILAQDFFDHNPEAPTVPGQEPYGIIIDESNLVQRISIALNAYRRQRDRIGDVMDQMKRIVSDE